MDSARQVYRYIRLTYLMNDLLNAVDRDVIGLQVGVELSYLTVPEQEMVEEVRKLMGAKEGDKEVADMETQLNSTVNSMSDPKKAGGGFNPMSIRIYVQQAFLYYRPAKKEDGTEEKSWNMLSA